MTNKIKTHIFILAVYLCCGLTAAGQKPQARTMRAITYIPSGFHNIEPHLGFSGTSSTECTPFYDDFSFHINQNVLINIPRKIICTSADSLNIPLCGAYSITHKRGLKYADAPRTVHIRREGDDTWYTGEIHETSYYYDRHVIPSLYYERDQEERRRMIEKAQKYSDEELDQDDSASGSSFNVNVLDYVDLPMTPGVYEVYLTMSGLESNMARVEIVFSTDHNINYSGEEDPVIFPYADIPFPDDSSVYVAGFEKNTHIYVAKQWYKDAVKVLGGNNDHYSWANDIFVSEGKVYTAGCEYGKKSNFARLWMDGVEQNIADGKKFARANSVRVSDGDVYMAGSGYDQGETTRAILWKNGSPRFLTDGNHSAGANSVYVHGGNVFTAGYEFDAEKNVAKVWKDDIPQSLSDGKHHAIAHSVCVAGGNVYAAGAEQDPRGRFSAKLWTNGKEQPLEFIIGNDYSVANSVFVSDGDVYVVGYEYDSVGRVAARLWKNGVPCEHTDGTPNAWALSVFVKNGDVYVSGHGYNERGNPVAVLWINGVRYFLTDGNNRAEANSVFVE